VSVKRPLSRRNFVKSAGSAVCCVCFPFDPIAVPDKEETPLAAACGTFCGACPAYLAKHGTEEEIQLRHKKRLSSEPVKASKAIPNPSWMDGILCDGCMSGGQLALHCQRCAIKTCAASKQNVVRCSDCNELPCYRITSMVNTGLLHRAEYLPNLEKIRKMGVQEWSKFEDERWRCNKCSLPMSWYDSECIRCGEKRSEKLFKLG
jgi:hypothetical protein